MMISNDLCTGCNACLNACPNGCISLVTDKEGFLQPHINKENCTSCKTCEKVCPVVNNPIKIEQKTPTAYAAWSKDELLLDKSSSGGMFGVFSRYIIRNNGVVFGAAYKNDLSVSHFMIESIEELDKLHGSKYVQSNTGLTFREVKDELNKEKLVLYSGTPCQLAGLYQYLGHDYDNLYTCDFICHGVPSPGVYKSYLDNLESRINKKIVNFQMRSKEVGWKPASCSIITFNDGTQIKYENAYKNSYMNGFLFNLYLRRSCYNCRYAKINRESDITLGDFWGLGKEAAFNHDTHQGISLVLANSTKGKLLFEACREEFWYEERNLTEATSGNSMLLPNKYINEFRDNFYKDYEIMSFDVLEKKYLRRDYSFSYKLKNNIIKFIGVSNLKKIKSLLRKGK